MLASDRYLIAIDLDNTILSELFSLNPSSVWSLIRAQDAGHIVMIATARPTCLALPYYRALGLRSLLSTVNGNYLHHPDDPGIPWIRHEIETRDAADVITALQEAALAHPWIQSDDHIYTLDGIPPILPYFKLMFRHAQVHVTDTLPSDPCGRIFATANTEEQFLTMKARFAHHPRLRVSGGPNQAGTWNVTFFSAAADKWTTVQEAAGFYGIPAENVICFGDDHNDRQMVMNASHGFVMCNGNRQLIADMQSLHKDVTTYPCAQGGVGYEVDKLLGL